MHWFQLHAWLCCCVIHLMVVDCQESRIGKAVEVMIQHVENLRRVYTKEHAELLELRETLMQNERSFGSHTERGSARGKLMKMIVIKNCGLNGT